MIPKISYILITAIVVRIVAYFTVNFILYDYNSFGHPDSYLYHYITLELQQLWNSGTFTISRYPEYTNLTALLYYLPGPDRLGPEVLNLCASVLTVYIGYITVLQVTQKKAAANITALILALDPYMVYLSTQYLRDTIILLGTAILVYGCCRNTFKASIAGILILGILRPLQSLTFIPLVLLSNNRKILPLLLTPIVFIILLYRIPWGVDLTEYVPVPPNAVQGSGPHIEFFSPQNPNSISYRNPIPYWYTLVNPLSYARSFNNFLFFPNPLGADTLIEKAFSLHSLFWYTIIVLGLVGLLAKFKLPREFRILLISGLMLGTLLALTTESQGPFVRWRLQLYYLMIPPLSLGIYYLKDYEVRKRAFDLIIISIFLVVLVPIYSIITCILYVTQKRVIFKQERVGFEGSTFTVYKFVTMKPNSDGKALSQDNDPRVTRIGKFLRKTTLDEIPSLVNVLKGNMTIVGPRPLAVWEDSECRKLYRGWDLRYEVKPGMIGLAQLHTDRRDNGNKLLYDLEYIRNVQSHKNDLKILLEGMIFNLTGRWR